MAWHHDPAFCAALGTQWIDAWNSHNLERILALYADDSEMTSDKRTRRTTGALSLRGSRNRRVG